MVNSEEAAKAALSYKTRCLNIYRKLRFDMQEVDTSPEIRDDALVLDKLTAAGEYEAAVEVSRKIVYLVGMTCERRYITEADYKCIKDEAASFVAAVSDREG